MGRKRKHKNRLLMEVIPEGYYDDPSDGKKFHELYRGVVTILLVSDLSVSVDRTSNSLSMPIRFMN